MLANNHGPARLVRDWNQAVSHDQALTKSGALVREEAAELVEACAGDDLYAIVKEACDTIWCALDVLIAHGVDFNAAFTELHRSNASKIGPNGEINRAPNGKITKGPFYQAPDPERMLGRGRLAA